MGIQSIVIIGTGNLTWHLTRLFKAHAFDVVQIYGRNAIEAKALADEINTEFTSDIKHIHHDADLYLMAVSDHAIVDIAFQLKVKKSAIVAHTAGSVSLDTLQFVSDNIAVFYPLQTFTKKIAVDFKSTPIFIEANNDDVKNALTLFAQTFSNSVKNISSADRLKLHLAAVVTSNFFNHLNTLTYDYLKDNNLQDLYTSLLPLLQTSVEKLKTNLPNDAQTGPAKRNDVTTINQHLHLLLEDEELRKIYEHLSQSITKYYDNYK
jgi:predicted short-subunit dehydrogenase-like oxidoreductase (DUF2520 family)